MPGNKVAENGSSQATPVESRSGDGLVDDPGRAPAWAACTWWRRSRERAVAYREKNVTKQPLVSHPACLGTTIYLAVASTASRSEPLTRLHGGRTADPAAEISFDPSGQTDRAVSSWMPLMVPRPHPAFWRVDAAHRSGSRAQNLRRSEQQPVRGAVTHRR